MEKCKTDIGSKLKLVLFTLGKTQDVLEFGNVLAINRHREALTGIVNQIDILKLQVVEEMFKEGGSEEDCLHGPYSCLVHLMYVCQYLQEFTINSIFII